MDTLADPATPLKEVYQAFFADLEMEGTKQTTIDRYRCNILRFEKWLIDNEHSAILASLERTILFGYRKYRNPAAAAPRLDPPPTRRTDEPPHGPLLSPQHQVPRLMVEGRRPSRLQPVPRGNPYFKKKGVMPVLQADDRIPKVGNPSDVALLLAGCVGDAQN